MNSFYYKCTFLQCFPYCGDISTCIALQSVFSFKIVVINYYNIMIIINFAFCNDTSGIKKGSFFMSYWQAYIHLTPEFKVLYS